MQQGPVVEVGPQRDHHRHTMVRIVDGHKQPVEESALHIPVLDEREELLELVDDQQQPGFVVGQHAQRSPENCQVAIGELRRQAVGRIEPGAEQGDLQLGERMGSGDHLCDQPGRGSRWVLFANARHQTGSDDAGLARSARPDQSEQTIATLNATDQLGDERFPAVEVGGIVLLKGMEALIWVAGIGRCRPMGQCACGRSFSS